jgi:ABC-type bacteriocin/lantibiotic exporter with double-glycine peptidase domain
MVDYGWGPWQQNHYLVVVGYTGEGVIINSGTKRMKLVRYNEFAPAWKRTGFWSLLVGLK